MLFLLGSVAHTPALYLTPPSLLASSIDLRIQVRLK